VRVRVSVRVRVRVRVRGRGRGCVWVWVCVCVYMRVSACVYVKPKATCHMTQQTCCLLRFLLPISAIGDPALQCGQLGHTGLQGIFGSVELDTRNLLNDAVALCQEHVTCTRQVENLRILRHLRMLDISRNAASQPLDALNEFALESLEVLVPDPAVKIVGQSHPGIHMPQ